MTNLVTARQKVLAHLNKTRTASAREISRALRMSVATVRHHLRVLVSDGRLEVASLNGHAGRGRPEKVYSLPPAALGDNLAALSDALLTEAGSDLQVEVLAKRLAEVSHSASGLLVKRLNLAIEHLDRMNYHARWEAGSEGPRLIFGHCPYLAILGKHPELCKMDRAMLEEWTRQPISQLSKTGKDGSSVCIFTTGR